MSNTLSDTPPESAAANVLILSTSLNPGSRSRVLAHHALTRLREMYPGLTAGLVDLQDLGTLPLAGSPEAREADERLQPLMERIRQASHVLFAVPIYNFAAGASAKNLIELMVMGDGNLDGKTAGFLCSAGGPRSYMSVLSLANSLMLDFRCWIIPRFVYATGPDFKDGVLTGHDVILRVDHLLTEMFEHGAQPPRIAAG